jgi:division protein CdvB (Snf7/Vps24/ESCRT-III family)
VSSLPS